MDPQEKPTWHRNGSTSVRPTRKGDKTTRRETQVGDIRGTGYGAQGGETGGRRMVLGDEVKKKSKQKKE